MIATTAYPWRLSLTMPSERERERERDERIA